MQPAKHNPNENDSGNEPEPQPGHSAQEKGQEPQPTQGSRPDELDEEMALDFLAQYQDLEQALVAAGYTRAGHSPAQAQPDWVGFARHIEARFDADENPVIRAAVAHLLWAEENLEMRNGRLERTDPWENASPHNDIVWLSELIQHTKNRVTHDLMFPGRTGCDYNNVTAAMFVLEAWKQIDPQVEQLVEQVHRQAGS